MTLFQCSRTPKTTPENVLLRRFDLRDNVQMGGGSAEFELEADMQAFTSLALSLPPVAPPAGLRGRLLARMGASTTPISPYGTPSSEGSITLSNEGKWTAVCEGVTRKSLYFDPQKNIATFLLRLDPGARLPAHSHGGTEQCLVLEGEVEDGELTLRAGDFQTLTPGSVHPVSRSKQGCLLLIVASEPAATRFV